MATTNSRRTTVNALDAELSSNAYIEVEILGETYQLRRKFKRLKFLRLLSSDPGSALALVFSPESLERLEDMDMDESDLEITFTKVSEALVGTKN
jgi:hypothetical protein